MRSKLVMRKVRPAHAIVGAAVMAVPGSAVVFATSQADAQSAQATPFAQSGGASPLATTPPTALASAAHFALGSRALHALGSQPVHVRGSLLPAVRGRVVTLAGRSGGGWHTLASARTGAHGAFDLRFSAGSATKQKLRVRFSGDQYNAASSASAGNVTVYHKSVASWYDDGGGTACGFHAHFGVANRTLPCGTKVSFYYGGHSVTAVVDDRGPFVSGRDWDLNQSTAGALGFGGVDSVWASQ